MIFYFTNNKKVYDILIKTLQPKWLLVCTDCTRKNQNYIIHIPLGLLDYSNLVGLLVFNKLLQLWLILYLVEQLSISIATFFKQSIPDRKTSFLKPKMDSTQTLGQMSWHSGKKSNIPTFFNTLAERERHRRPSRCRVFMRFDLILITLTV